MDPAESKLLLDPVKARAKGKEDAPTSTPSANFRLNVLFLRRFCRVLRVAFGGPCTKPSLMLVFLLLARAAGEYNYYNAGVLPSKFYAVLEERDSAGFTRELWLSAIVILSTCVCKSAVEMVCGILYVSWRELLTRFLQRLYFTNLTYYHLNMTLPGAIDNPDQRITQDVDKFCQQLSTVTPQIILSPFVIAYYTYQTYCSMGYIGPLSIYALFLLSTLLNKLLMGPVVSRVVSQERLEGDFRFRHVEIRTKAESIAFYNGGNLEANKLTRLMEKLLGVQLSVVHWQFPLNMSVNVFDYAGSILSYSLVGIAIFSGRFDDLSLAQLGAAISKNAFLSMYLLNNFSTLVDQATAFSDIAGYTHRIGELMEVLQVMNSEKKHDRSDKHPPPATTPNINCPSINSDKCTPPLLQQDVEVACALKDLSISPPSQTTPLVEGLSLEVKKGKNILITGKSGAGKTSILRVLKSLWRPLEGTATLYCADNHHQVMFLPQRPYLTSGPLAAQVYFPEQPRRASRERTYQGEWVFDAVDEAVKMAGLSALRDRLGGNWEVVDASYYNQVSPGEMQRIAFARIFFHRPHFVVLDEATSSLSEDTERQLYSLLQQLDITFVSIGHRSSLKQYHDHTLHIP